MKDQYNLSPSKDTYRSLKSDVSPVSAVKELIDNVLDNWERIKQENPDINIEIEFDPDEGYFRIRDDSGGIEEKHIDKIFSLGETTVGDVSRTIGAFGMGAKKAIVRLGKTATIKSRTHNSSTGYGFTVDEEWLNRKDDWTIESEAFPNLEPGTTVIRITDLQLSFSDKEDDEPEVRFTEPGQFIEELLSELSETYEEFLTGRATPDEGDLTITVNGNEVESPDQPQWSYTPFDNFHPKEFRHIELDVPQRDEPVYMDLKAGLLTSGGQEDAGTDIYIQDRKIVSRSTEEDGGWGTEFLPNYQPGLGRSRFQIRLYTDGATDTLPWDTQKSNIDPFDPIMREAFNWLKRAGEKFVMTYEKLPGKFTEPYTKSHSQSASLSTYDYEGRERVSHKKGHTPNASTPQAEEIDKAVKKHINDFSIFAPKLVKEELRPGYEAHYGYHSDVVHWEVPEEIISTVNESILYCWIEEVNKAARNDASNSQRIEFGEEKSWWVPYYDQQLSKYSEEANFDSTRDRPQIESRVEERKNEGKLPSANLSEKTASSKMDIVEGEEGIESKQGEEGDSKRKAGAESQTQQNEGDQKEETEDEASNGIDDGGEEDTSTDGSTDKSDSRSGTWKADENKELIIIQPDRETYELLCEELGVSPSESPDKVGNELLLRFIDLLQTVSDSKLGSRE